MVLSSTLSSLTSLPDNPSSDHLAPLKVDSDATLDTPIDDDTLMLDQDLPSPGNTRNTDINPAVDVNMNAVTEEAEQDEARHIIEHITNQPPIDHMFNASVNEDKFRHEVQPERVSPQEPGSQLSSFTPILFRPRFENTTDAPYTTDSEDEDEGEGEDLEFSEHPAEHVSDISEPEPEPVDPQLENAREQWPELEDHYRLVGCLGEGTFSAVYKSLDRYSHLYDNSKWRNEDVSLLRNVEVAKNYRRIRGWKTNVAVKKINATSSPDRILNELEIMHQLQDERNCAKLITAFRIQDQVFAIMPLVHHSDFRDYYRRRDLEFIHDYLLSLFEALTDTHKYGIIHRDVKPANFLFNTCTRKGVLCDFGLAEYLDEAGWHGKCLHTLPAFYKGEHHGQRLERPKPALNQLKEQNEDWEENGDHDTGAPKRPYKLSDKQELSELQTKEKMESDWFKYWEPANKTKTNRGKNVGYLKPELEKRPTAKANRAGTRGFRAPEVLFKCADQTPAIDVWSVGVILLAMLTERFPFFQSNDDTEAMMEIAAMFGRKRMTRCAVLHNRTFLTNAPNVEKPAYPDMHRLVFDFNPEIFRVYSKTKARVSVPRYSMPTETPETFEEISTWYTPDHPLYQCIDLLSKCLHLDLTKRIQACDALSHPFLTE